jgi:hypothetical protein
VAMEKGGSKPLLEGEAATAQSFLKSPPLSIVTPHQPHRILEGTNQTLAHSMGHAETVLHMQGKAVVTQRLLLRKVGVSQ